MQRKSALLAIGVALGGLLTLGDSAPARGESLGQTSAPHTVVIISIDTLRADRLPAYGYKEGETPNLDRLASEGILFRQAYSPIPLTLPAHASLFTGKLPHEHGVRDNLGYVLDSGHERLASLFSQHGFATGAAVSSFVLRSATGIAKGFDFYDDELPDNIPAALSERDRPGFVTMSRAIEWLGRQQDRQVFLFVHLYEPHAPYIPPGPYSAGAATPYDGEISAADAAVGLLFDKLEAVGRYDDALILFTSDHGEGLGDHGEREHGVLLYRETIHVPMILKLPGSQAAGTAVNQPVSLIDIFPTLTGMLGGSVLPASGRDLRSYFEGGSSSSPTPQRVILAETFYPRLRLGWSEQRSAIAGDHHLIVGPSPELFNLHQDPEELNNLAGDRPEVVARLRMELDKIAPLTAPLEVDAVTIEALTSLGYLTGTVPTTTEETLPDPRSRIGSIARLQENIDLLREDPAKAVPAFEDLVRSERRMVDAVTLLGLAYEKTGQLEKAAKAYRRAIDLGAPPKKIGPALGSVLVRLGQPEEALPLLELGIDASREQPDTAADHRFLKTRALIDLDRLADAESSARENVSALGSADAHYQLGLVLIYRERPPEAEIELRRALEIASDHPAALADLAALLTRQQRFEEAEIVFSRLREIKPGDPQIEKQYQWFLSQAGRSQ